jgi:crotonobetainyl-CoA:carnitine CoA-transferase CaiB-like acyl-CoA transferase
MALPFSGIRVLDLTAVLSGPFCSYQLALLGADVIKIEQPDKGDQSRIQGADPALNRAGMGTSFLAQNAGKRSVALNLKGPLAKQAFLRLVDTADVVLENFRPGVMERLGLGAATLRARKPALIYCAISGFGQESPYRDNPAYDQIIQGLSGAMSTTGERGGRPLRAGYPVGDTSGGMNAAFAIAAALCHRFRTGEGQTIDVALLDNLMSMLGWVASSYLVGAAEPRPGGNDNAVVSPSGAFRTQDQPINIAANNHAQFVALCGAIGRPDLAADPRFATLQDRIDRREELRTEIERALATRPAAEWEEILNRQDVPAGRILPLGEALRHPHVAARRLLQRFDGAPGVPRPFEILTTGFRLSSGVPHAPRPPPALGEHTAEVLAAAGLSADEIAALQRERA